MAKVKDEIDSIRNDIDTINGEIKDLHGKTSCLMWGSLSIQENANELQKSTNRHYLFANLFSLIAIVISLFAAVVAYRSMDYARRQTNVVESGHEIKVSEIEQAEQEKLYSYLSANFVQVNPLSNEIRLVIKNTGMSYACISYITINGTPISKHPLFAEDQFRNYRFESTDSWDCFNVQSGGETSFLLTAVLQSSNTTIRADYHPSVSVNIFYTDGSSFLGDKVQRFVNHSNVDVPMKLIFPQGYDPRKHDYLPQLDFGRSMEEGTPILLDLNKGT